MSRPRRRPGRSARDEAHAILAAVDAGRGHSTQMLAALPDAMDGRDRALVTEIVYGVLRRRAGLDRLIERVASRPIAAIDPDTLAAVRMGLYQAIHLDRIPRPAAVDESVRIVRRRRGRAAAAFANAVLRKACAGIGEGGAGRPARRDAEARPDADPAAARLAEDHSFPPRLVERWLGTFGAAECAALLRTMNLPAPMALRPARRSGGAAALAERLRSEGVRTAPSPLLPEALRVEAGAPQKTAAFRDGWFYIQDEASQIVALLLEPLAGARAVLDACAAPGGKILGALDAAGPAEALWVAADASPARLRLLRDNALRLRLRGLRLVAMDASRPALRPGFDRILVDAPCSGTGIIRRHPEIRWRRTPSDFAAQAARQGDILRAALDLAAPGGRIVYAVCSLEPEEGPRVVDDATRGRDDVLRVGVAGLLPPGLARLACADGSLLTLPHRDDTDGFFAAVLQKRG